MSTPPYKVELWNQGPKIHPQAKFEINPIKIGKLELFGVTTRKHDNDIIETKCWWCHHFFWNVRSTLPKFQG